MKAYLLTAVGVIFLTLTVSFIVPEGKLKKSVNFILRLVSICVIIQPVSTIFKFESNDRATVYDYDYVCSVYSQNQSRLVTQKVCDEVGVDCICVVEVIYDGKQIKENGVTVEGNFTDEKTIAVIAEYLEGLGYINITVNEKAA